MALAILVALASCVFGCSPIQPGPDGCRPVDEGGECFAPSREAFLEHALTSARSWPQLDGLVIEPVDVISAVDAAGQPTWIVPLRANGRIVAASRFLPFGDEVRLGEVAIYLPPRDQFPTPVQNERLVIFTQACGDPMPATCLFREHGWRFEPAP